MCVCKKRIYNLIPRTHEQLISAGYRDWPRECVCKIMIFILVVQGVQVALVVRVEHVVQVVQGG